MTAALSPLSSMLSMACRMMHYVTSADGMKLERFTPLEGVGSWHDCVNFPKLGAGNLPNDTFIIF